MRIALLLLVVAFGGCRSVQCTIIGEGVTAWYDNHDQYFRNMGAGKPTRVIVGGVDYADPQIKLCDDGSLQWEARIVAKEKP